MEAIEFDHEVGSVIEPVPKNKTVQVSEEESEHVLLSSITDISDWPETTHNYC